MLYLDNRKLAIAKSLECLLFSSCVTEKYIKYLLKHKNAYDNSCLGVCTLNYQRLLK